MRLSASFLVVITTASCHAPSPARAPMAPPPVATRVPDAEPAVAEPLHSDTLAPCHVMPDDAQFRVSLPSRYDAVALATFLTTATCKRVVFATRKHQRSHTDPVSSSCDRAPEEDEECGELIHGSEVIAFVEAKLHPLGMTALVRDEEVIFVEGTPSHPGPEPVGASRTVLDPNRPWTAETAGVGVEAEREAREQLAREREARERQAAAAAELLKDHVACSGSKCTIDTAGIAPLVDDRLLRLRLVPNRAIAGGLKLYGLQPTSLLGLVGVRNGFTLVTVDGTPAADAMDSNKALPALLEQLLSAGGTTKLEFVTREGAPVSIELVFR